MIKHHYLPCIFQYKTIVIITVPFFFSYSSIRLKLNMASKFIDNNSGSYSFCMFTNAESNLGIPSKLAISRENSSSSSVSDNSFVTPLSLEDSPLSSPSDVECFQPIEDVHTNNTVDTKVHSNNKKSVGMKSWSSSLPVGVRLPQRKGGMHLWQFLYSILQMPDKYSHLIEWTSNHKEFEFRLIEPDSIAVWWGYHKNKKNMSYDKLSRSLRYYYDKQIIRKIGGERYVYRFCVDPEVMYQAIGNSENRPKLKPMPKSAESMLLKNQQARNNHQQTQMSSSPCSVSKPTFVAEEADILNHCSIKTEASLPTSSTCSLQYPPAAVCSYDMGNGNNNHAPALHAPIEYSMSMDPQVSSISMSSATGWQQQTQDKPTAYQNDVFQDLNYLYQMYPNAESSAASTRCLPPNLVQSMNESFMPPQAMASDIPNPACSLSSSPQSQFATYKQQQSSAVTTSSISDMPPLNSIFSDSRHINSPYYSPVSCQNFVSESDQDFSSTLPSTIDSVATCNEYHSSMPIVYPQDLNNSAGMYAVYDNPVGSWPLVSTNTQISAEFNNW